MKDTRVVPNMSTSECQTTKSNLPTSKRHLVRLYGVKTYCIAYEVLEYSRVQRQ
jgi:hypothetical protein